MYVDRKSSRWKFFVLFYVESTIHGAIFGVHCTVPRPGNETVPQLTLETVCRGHAT